MTVRSRGTMPAILRGVVLIARGRAEGLNCFGDTPRAVLASLVPGVGLSFGTLAAGLAEGQGLHAVGDMAFLLCVLLAPVVVSFELTRAWGREAFWNRYIVAFNWCLLLIPMLILIVGLVVGLATGLAGLVVLNVFLCGYALWMNWFLARHALALTAGRSAWLVAGVHVGTALLIAVPAFLAGALA